VASKRPLVMPKEKLPKITEFSSQIIEGKIKLTWRYSDGKAEGFKIFKGNCKGCPLLEIGEIRIREKKGVVSWIDRDIHPGNIYFYQVVGFYKGKLGQRSKMLEVRP